MSHGGGSGSGSSGGSGGTIASQEEAQQLRRQTTELLYRFHRKQQHENEHEKELYGDDSDDETGVNRGENVWDMITDEEYEQILTRQFQQKTSLNSKKDNDDNNHDHMVYPSVIQQDFEKALIDGRLSKWISVWEPWWLSSSPLSSSVSPSASSISQQKLPPLSQLVSNQTNSNSNRVLRFYLVEMVYAFAYVMRLYNGEFCEDENTIDESEVSDEKLDLLFEMIDVLLSLCPNSLHVMNTAVSSLSHSVIRYDNVTQVILNVLEMMTTMNATTAFAHDPQNRKELQCRSIHVLNDVIMILKNKAHVVRCLSQLHSMVLRLIDHLKEQQKRNTQKKNEKTVVTMNRLERMAMQQEQQSSFIKQSAGSSLGKQIKFLRLVERKIYFYRVWCNEQSESTLFELSQDVESEYEQQQQLEMQK